MKNLHKLGFLWLLLLAPLALAQETVTDAGLENQTWTVINNTSVNAVPADGYLAQTVGGVLENVIVASKPYGGALSYVGTAVPEFAGNPLPYVGLDLDVYIPDEAAALARCLETDLKVSFLPPPTGSTTTQNLADLSSQICPYNGGTLQIDNQAATWASTGFLTGTLPVDTWFHESYRYQVNPAAKTYSTLSITVNGKQYVIPASMQNLSWQTTNWAQTAHIQLQLDNNTTAGAFLVKYKNIVLTWSNTAF